MSNSPEALPENIPNIDIDSAPHENDISIPDKKYPTHESNILRFLLDLGFRIEKLQNLVAKNPELSSELLRIGSLRTQIISLAESYHALRDTAGNYDNMYKEIAAITPQPTELVRHLSALKDLRSRAYHKEISALAIESVSNAVEKFEKGVTTVEVEAAQQSLQSYLKVSAIKNGEASTIEISDDQIYPDIIREIVNNPKLKYIVVAGPPGSGKTRAIEALGTLLQDQGIVAIENRFDRLFASVMKFLGIPTSEWNKYDTKEFDKQFLHTLPMIDAQYPLQYKLEEKNRYVVIIDALGYPANVKYPWHLLKGLAPLINDKQGLVVSIVAEDAVIKNAMETRAPGSLDPTDAKAVDESLKKGGAPAEAIQKHITNFRKFIRKKTKHNQELTDSVASVNLENTKFERYARKLEDMRNRLGYAFWLRDDLRIDESQWLVAVNFLVEK